ncbi:MAG: cytochrome P450 [Planktomarina sp.]
MTNSPPPVKVPLVTEPKSILQTLRAARHNVLEMIPQLTVEQPIVSGKTAMVQWHMVMDPASLRHIMLENLDNYPKSDVMINVLEPGLGKSVFTAEGAHWRWQRRAASPAFAHRNVDNLAPIMTLAADKLVSRLNGVAGQSVDMFPQMSAVTFDIISDVTFSDHDGFDAATIYDAIERYSESVGKASLLDIVGAPQWIPRVGRLFAKQYLREIRASGDTKIERRRVSGPRQVPDFLDLLVSSEDPKTGRRMTTTEIRDNLLTFIVAGHETTALALSWALYLCGFNTDVQDRARAEAQSVLHGRTATAADVPNLPYIRMIIDEAMRLYPPAAFLSRTAQNDDTVPGMKVKKGDTVILPIYSLHRNKLLWDDPDTFDPERFKDPKAIDRYAYIPFGNGPRVCIGAHFALQETVIVLATLLSKFKFTKTAGKPDPEPIMIITLRPENGVWLDIEPA